jgi:hypothetical protein
MTRSETLVCVLVGVAFGLALVMAGCPSSAYAGKPDPWQPRPSQQLLESAALAVARESVPAGACGAGLQPRVTAAPRMPFRSVDALGRVFAAGEEVDGLHIGAPVCDTQVRRRVGQPIRMCDVGAHELLHDLDLEHGSGGAMNAPGWHRPCHVSPWLRKLERLVMAWELLDGLGTRACRVRGTVYVECRVRGGRELVDLRGVGLGSQD